jgi:hypothetical protein
MADEMRTVYGNGIHISPEDMSLTSGCNLAFVAVIMTLADAGDEVILPVPWFVLGIMHISINFKYLFSGISTISNKLLRSFIRSMLTSLQNDVEHAQYNYDTVENAVRGWVHSVCLRM